MSKVSDEVLRGWVAFPDGYDDQRRSVARELLQRRGWQKCEIHGEINADHAWGCPECVRELRAKAAEKTVWTKNEFVGPPPAPYDSWSAAIEAMTQANLFSRLKIAALDPSPEAEKP